MATLKATTSGPVLQVLPDGMQQYHFTCDDGTQIVVIAATLEDAQAKADAACAEHGRN